MNKGGRYIVNERGERELVEHTQPAKPKSSDDETTQHSSDAKKPSGADAATEAQRSEAGAISPRPPRKRASSDKGK